MLARADGELAAVAKMDDKWAAPLALQGWLGYRLARLDLGTGWNVRPRRRGSTPGLARAERAMAIAPNDADALEARGTLHYLQWLLNLAPKDPNALVKSAEADLNASVLGEPGAGVGAQHAEPPAHLHVAHPGRKDSPAPRRTRRIRI